MAARNITIVVWLMCGLAAVTGSKIIRVPIWEDSLVNISIGNPPQDFQVVLNTGSAGSWVIGSESWMKSYAFMGARYHGSQSSTHRKDNRDYSTVLGVSLVLNGTLSVDHFKIGGLEVRDQLFAEMKSVLGWYADFAHFSGVLGLGSKFSPSVTSLDPVQNMFKQGLIEQQMFSIFMDKPAIEPTGQQTGTWILGGIDEELYTGEITYTPIEKRWEFQLDSVAFDDGQETMIGATAILDSSSNMIVCPLSWLNQALVNNVVRFRSDLKAYVIDYCVGKAFSDITLTIEGRKFTIPSEDLVSELRLGKETICVLHMSSSYDIGQRIILGTPFMKRHYTIYDYTNKRIGIATRK